VRAPVPNSVPQGTAGTTPITAQDVVLGPTRHSLANRGLIRTVAVLPGKVISRFMLGSAADKQAFLLHPFDAEFVTDTGDLSTRKNSATGAAGKASTTQPTMPRRLLCSSGLLRASKSILRALPLSIWEPARVERSCLLPTFPFDKRLALSMRASWQRWRARISLATTRLPAYARRCAALLGTLAILRFQPAPW
jgi:hypothetical protein